jgi:AraC-like DNA-binding protein
MILLNLPGVFGIAAVAVALMLMVKVAYTPASDRTGKYLLQIFLGGLLAMALNSMYFLFGLHLTWPNLSYLYFFVIVWIGPAFWFYTARVLGLGVAPFAWPSAWHWIPGIVLQVLLIPYTFMPGAAKLEVLTGRTGVYFPFFVVAYLFLYVEIAVYLLITQRALTRHRALIALTPEKEELRVDLAWINLVIYGLAGFLFLDGFVPNLRLFVPGLSFSVAMALYLFIIVAAFHATVTGRVYPFGNPMARSDPKYVNSGLRDDTAQHYLGKLDRVMREEQPHLDSDLSLDKLAGLVRVHPHHLSQALNDHLGKNFYDYINEQRIGHARKLLAEQPDLPVVDVAIASGYNNKNSFYNSFRRFVGQTPTEFRAQAAKSDKSMPETG